MRLAIGLVLAYALGTQAARADELAEAKDLFARGRALRLQGDCTGAIPLFLQASKIYPAGLGSLRNTAECEETLLHFAAARGAWLELGRALHENRDPRYEGWALDVEQGAKRAEDHIVELTPDDARAAATKGDPGNDAGPKRLVPPARGEGMRIGGWVLLGVGGASAVAAGVALIVRQVALDELPPCAATQCADSSRQTVQPTVDRGHLASTLVNVFGAIGVAGVAGGLVLLSIAPPRSQGVAVAIGPSALHVDGRF